MIDQTIVVGPFQCNCRILACPETGHAALVDPGDDPQRIIDAVSKQRLPNGNPISVKYLFHTHGHLDHIGGTRQVRETLPSAPEILLHKDDEPLYMNLAVQGQMFGLTLQPPLSVDRYFQDEEEIQVGELKFSVIHTPGHSPGSVCLRLHEDSGRGVRESLFSGDTLFKRSVGRTDLWGGSGETMFKSIRQRLLTLDDETRVCPGHGPETRIGEERRENPFL